MGNGKWAIDCFLTAAMSNGDDDHHGQQIQNNHNRPPPAAASSILATALSDNSMSGNRTPQRRVDHTYRDYSNFPLEELPTRKRAPTNFPSKLHQILSNPEYAHIISWMPHGRAWKIHNKDLLIRDIVPKYFVQSKYESFTRQLNGWGFKRLHQSGNDFNAYYHECFLRNMPHLTVLLKRVAPNQGKLLPHVEGEPNFYEIEKQFPLPPHHGMMPYVQGYHHPYPSPSALVGNGYHAGVLAPPSEIPAQARPYPAMYPGSYPPQPPYYGHLGDPNAAAAAAANQMNGYPPYPSYYSAQFEYDSFFLIPNSDDEKTGADGIAAPTSHSRRRVDHTYRDYSKFPLEELPTRKRAPTNFPSKLHQILSNPEYAHVRHHLDYYFIRRRLQCDINLLIHLVSCREPSYHCINRSSRGWAWKIHNKDLLIQDIVPKYFVQSKYESFTRQLNGWGFKRLHQSGNDFNAYYHECFLRNMPHLTVLLKRVAPNQGKLLPHVEGEPNFYEIDKQFPLSPHPNMMPYEGFHQPPHQYQQHHAGHLLVQHHLPYSSALLLNDCYHIHGAPVPLPQTGYQSIPSLYPGTSHPPQQQPYYYRAFRGGAIDP
ncbi:hypothetical protein ACHAWU_006808 [Discostella pseudostelligera]|uniref:HSF-type DNA-binding domain-containing protein n=1 Tax=Discostella pseudostelligera TaxID=259834 RepID=A0ABD3MZA7_9STRA